MLAEGIGLKQDYTEALCYLEKAAHQEHPNALCVLGFMCERGQGMAANERKTLEYYKRSAQKGNPAAMRNYALCHHYGTGRTKNDRKAFKLMARAAATGFNLAIFSLVRSCSVVEISGVDFLIIIIKNKNNTLQATMYEGGQGVGRNERRAIELYKQAAARGCPSALCNLGIKYERGQGGLFADEKKALELYREAAEAGEPAAQFNMGVMYLQGKGMDAPDMWQACEWYSRSSLSDHKNAAVNLGNIILSSSFFFFFSLLLLTSSRSVKPYSHFPPFFFLPFCRSHVSPGYRSSRRPGESRTV